MKSRNTKPKKGKSQKKKVAKFAFRFSFLVIKMLLIICLTISFALAGLAGGAVFAYIKNAEKLTPDKLTLDGFTSYVYDCNDEMIIPCRDQKQDMVDLKDILKILKMLLLLLKTDVFMSIQV